MEVSTLKGRMTARRLTPICRDHVRADLEPYVCLVDECDKSDELFRHSDDWLKHLRGHYLRWQCKTKAHGVQLFESQKAYEDHMRGAHDSTLTPAQLSLLAERSTRMAQPLFTTCPLCGEDESKVPGKMQDHVVGHLRFLALKSLPPTEDDVEEDSDASETSGSRSTIKGGLLTLRALLTFNDPPDQSRHRLLHDPWRSTPAAFSGYLLNGPATEGGLHFEPPLEDGPFNHDGVRSNHLLDDSEPFAYGAMLAYPQSFASPLAEWMGIWEVLESRDAKYHFSPVDQDPTLQHLIRAQASQVEPQRKSKKVQQLLDAQIQAWIRDGYKFDSLAALKQELDYTSEAAGIPTGSLYLNVSDTELRSLVRRHTGPGERSLLALDFLDPDLVARGDRDAHSRKTSVGPTDGRCLFREERSSQRRVTLGPYS